MLAGRGGMLHKRRGSRWRWGGGGGGGGGEGAESESVERLLRVELVSSRALARLQGLQGEAEPALRMGLRTALVRDTHNHDAVERTKFNSILNRNRIVKDISRVNRELVKIKNNMNNKNMKNGLILKHSNFSNKRTIYNKRTKDEDFENVFNENEISFMSQQDSVKDNILGISKGSMIEINENETEDNLECVYLHERGEELLNCGKKVEINNCEVDVNRPVEDLQSALTLMTIYSSVNEDEQVLSRIENSKNNDINILNGTEESNAGNLEIVPNNTELRNSDFLTIVSFTIIMKQEALSKKYFLKWKQYVENKKGMTEIRKATLNTFFEKLMQRKCELKKNAPQMVKGKLNKAQQLATDQQSYQHRYQVQKNIIALQKLKLEEQNRIIEELKYNKIVEACKDSVESMREDLKNTYADIDRRMKPKLKCLTNELQLHEIEEPALVLHCLKVPQFLQRMERRAREREEKHAIIRERRRQMEEERMRMKQQAELAKVEMDKEEKMKRMKELKAKRRQEKIDNIRRKQHVERMRAFRVMADLHYERNVLWRCGLKPWKILIEIKHDNIAKALAHYEFQLKKNVFLHWMWHTEDMWMERNYKAEDCYRKKLLKKTFGALKTNHHALVIKQQVADDYYDLYVTQVVFRKFKENIALLKKERELKWQAAVKYHENNIKFRALTQWRMLPALNRLQRDKESRKTKWRQKVLQVVPDYTPPEDD